MFRVDDDSLARHIGERRPRGELEASYLSETTGASQSGRNAAAAAEDMAMDEDLGLEADHGGTGGGQLESTGEPAGEREEEEAERVVEAEEEGDEEENGGEEEEDAEGQAGQEGDGAQSQAAQSPSVSSGADAGRRLTARERRLLKQARKRGDTRVRRPARVPRLSRARAAGVRH